jgi:hypothetical protein
MERQSVIFILLELTEESLAELVAEEHGRGLETNTDEWGDSS